MPQLSETSLVLDTLRRFVVEHPQVKRWLVAYSGGLDSSVLLKALRELQLDVEVEAVHVNHGLSDHANAWQDHCQRCCQELGVKLHTQSVEVQRQGRGLEDAAREARYSVFESLMDADTALLLGHHADDQAETLMMRLMRGSGTRGMAGIQASRPLAQGILCRPLLSLEQEQLRQQAQAWQLRWIDDESNDSDAFDRNFLRLAVIPALKQRWPHLAQRAAQTAHWCREADQLVLEVAAEDLARVQPRSERLGASLDWTVWRDLSDYRRGNLLRLWCESQRLDLPERVHLDELSTQFLRQSPDSSGEVCWGNVCIRYFRQRLYCLAADASVSLAELPKPIEGWLGEPMAWGGGEISLQPVAEGGFRLPREGFDVSLREAGERCHPSWRDRSQTLKKLLQESQLEPWLRGIVPCLRERHQLAVVGDLWHCQGWQAEGERGYRLHWQLRRSLS
ncbi:MAG: tRNA lysidine(34) synthetase TilS [Cellvibrionaceae bacterium]|nr:tRNA lysidine(34) synthetase TilS [Cellvibrionaceae bacterium]|tara:strand:+ start:12941 stop:14290 length:1350 start_codon:yes stop_codon:yes gene_type:complete